MLAQLERRVGRFITLGDGHFAELTQSALERLALLEAFRAPSPEAASIRLPLFAALTLPVPEGECSESSSSAWNRLRARLAAARTKEPRPTKQFRGELRDYQKLGFRWLCEMAVSGTGACLADDMGLGKTIQTLSFLQYRATRKLLADEVAGPMLIVAPASVCPGWLAEVARFTPNLVVRWLTGPERHLAGASRKTVFVCTYDVLHRDLDTLRAQHFDTVVLDEAHHIKNAHTRRARAAFALDAGFRIATTGTPLENHLGELWSLFHFLVPGLLGEQQHFIQYYRMPIEIGGNTRRKQQLRLLIRPFILRRTKQQVLAELPPKTELIREVTLSSAESELYEAIRQRGLMALTQQVKDQNQQRVRVLAEIMRLRRACCHPRLVLPDSELGSSKLAAFLELTEELRAGGHRALVFSQFVDHLTLVREALDDIGCSYQYLDGSTKLDDRERAVRAFQRGEGEIFLISLRAGGTGLNLTAADYVIHLDPWWNPAVEDQASDRAHRIGQERPVTIYRLITRGTIEQRLVAMNTEKRTLAADILSDFDSKPRLNPDELLALLRDAALGT